MKAAALIFCTLAHPCNIDMYINNCVVLWFLLWFYWIEEVPVFGLNQESV